MDRYTSGAYARDNPGWHAEGAGEKAAGVLRALDAVGWSFTRVLDVGCGTGDVLRHLRATLDARGRTDVRYTGWDPGAPPQAPGDARLALHRGDPLTEADPADVVLCLDVFEHVPDDAAFLRALRRLGPRVVFRVPLDLSVLDVLRPHRLIEARRRYGHLHAYTRRSALALLDEAGFAARWTGLDRVRPPTPTLRSRGVDAARVALVGAAPHLGVDLVGGFSLLVAAEVR